MTYLSSAWVYDSIPTPKEGACSPFTQPPLSIVCFPPRRLDLRGMSALCVETPVK
jgi:hypothetical protein